MSPHQRTATLLMIVVLAASSAFAEGVRIGLLGSSYMQPVQAALNRLGLDCERLEASELTAHDPDSLDVLFLGYDALDQDRPAAPGAPSLEQHVEWLTSFRASDGLLFTFYSLPAGLRRVLGIQQGEYLRREYDGQFASIRRTGVIPHLPEVVSQRSHNIMRASPRADSVQVIAHWFDTEGRDTGHPALLLGPGGAHLTHVLRGDDVDGAAHLYAALLGHFHPDLWPEMVTGALRGADRVAGDQATLERLVRGRARAEESLGRCREAASQGDRALQEGRYAEALQAAFRARKWATQAYARIQETRDRELRAVWIHNPFGVADWGWDVSMEVLANAGFNAVIPNMLDAGVTSYPSDVLPADPRVAERGDQMAALVQAAHRHGIEVHAWKVNYNLMGADSAFLARMRVDERLQADTSGEEVMWLCPSHPDNVVLEAESMLEVVRNYAVDGIHFDYIRYPGVEGCYCEGCRARFQNETGHVVRDWPQDVLTGELLEPFQKWRQEQVTKLVRTVAVHARQLRPQIQISAAVFSNWPETRYTVGQDWVDWVEAGYLDFVCPMDYIPETETFMARVRDQVSWVDGRVPLYIGIGSWQMGDPVEVLRQIAFTREAGADGFVLFEYNVALAQRLFPLIRAGLTAAAAEPTHRGPPVHLAVRGVSSGEVPAGTGVYREGEPLRLSAQLVVSELHPVSEGSLSWQSLAGQTVRDVAALSSAAKRPQNHVAELPAGDYRPAVTGTYRDARGEEHSFKRRGPVVRVREAAFMDSLERLYSPPEILGEGTPLAVYTPGYGAASLATMLAEDAGLAVYRLRHLTDAALAATDVLVIPQPHNRWAIDRMTRQRLRDWVRHGGGLLVTHDMVGIRGAQPVIPEVCRRGTGYPRSTRWQATAQHPAVEGVPSGLQPHTYYDHITVEPGPAGRVVAEDDEGRPVLVVGEFGEGRYAALGLVPGLGPGDREVLPQAAERALVESLVAWLASR